MTALNSQRMTRDPRMEKMWVSRVAVLWWTGMVCTSVASDPLLPPMNGVASDFAPRRAGAEVNASLKMIVTQEGLYRVGQADFVAAGVAGSALVGSQIRLYCTTQEVSILVSNDGLWTTGDYLLFFGQKYEGYYTDTNVYWLGFGGAGRRMASRSATPLPGPAPVTNCVWQARYHRDCWFQELYRPEDDGFDHWFAEVFRSDLGAKSVSLATDQFVASKPATLRATLYGYTSSSAVNPDHCTRIKVNGTTITNFLYDGQSTFIGKCVFPGTRLAAMNSVSFQQIPQGGLPADTVFLEEFTIDYTRDLKTSSFLVFPGQPGTNNYRVGGFATNTGFWVMDVSSPSVPVLLTGTKANKVSGKYAVDFSDARGGEGRYVVCHTSALQRVSKIERTMFRNLASTDRQADFIVICPYAFRQPAYRLLARRHLEGLNVAVAPLPDIYNEFSYGIADAAAIKQFIGYAFHHWRSSPPRYVLLAGNGSYDPKRNLVGTTSADSYKAPDLVPVHMGASPYGRTAQDGWYVQVNGTDRLPDLALGRIPAEDAAVFGNVVDKIVAFENTPAGDVRRTKALLAADKIDGSMNFKNSCETIRTTLLSPAGFVCTKAYNDDAGAATIRQTIIAAFNAGTLLACYFGHGAMDQWGVDNICDTNDVAKLTNTFFPVVSMLTCINGYFQSPTDKKSMVESFLERTGRGASACIASPALTLQFSNEAFTRGFIREFVTERTRRLGDAFLEGCAELFALNPTTQELLSLEVFGDPTMTVNPP